MSSGSAGERALLDRMAARCLVFGFDGSTLTAEARALLARGAGGLILFSRNIESVSQVLELTEAARAAASSPVLVSVDQEGGRVARLRGLATDLPPMRSLASLGAETAELVGGLMGSELSAMGFDLVLAPVADVDTNPKNPVIGDRAFSSDPDEVARLTTAFVEGARRSGLGACAKHFPGHGDTTTDSHIDLPVVDHDRSRLDRIELVPFVALARAGVATVMTAHVRVERIDGARPATMSRRVLSILRDEIGYDGVVISDCLEMAAVADRFEMGQAAVEAIGAGCDQVLVCHSPERQKRVMEALVEATLSGVLPRGRLAEAAARVDRLADRLDPWRARPNLEVVRSPAHRSIADSVWAGARAVSLGPDPTGGT